MLKVFFWFLFLNLIVRVKKKVSELQPTQTLEFILDNLSKTSDTVKEFIYLKKEKDMKANCLMEKERGKASIITIMVMFTKENETMIIEMGMEYKPNYVICFVV